MYNIIQEIKTSEFIEKKSKFISLIEPISSENDVLSHYHALKSEHFKANHVAYAFRLLHNNQIIYRFKDDGEPSGSAGKPIYNFIEGNSLINVAIYVIRYFGGIKLGVGGLVKAYGKAAYDVIHLSDIIPYIEMSKIKVEINYNHLQRIEKKLPTFQAIISSKEFTDKILIDVILPKNQLEAFLEFVGNK
jgi:uncharacterized YigZ family protein